MLGGEFIEPQSCQRRAEEALDRISIVFANKGDTPKNFFAAIAQDRQIIEAKFVSVFGPPTRGLRNEIVGQPFQADILT